jgi:NTE family protein
MEAPRSALAVAVQSLTLLIEQRLIGEVTRYAGEVDVHVMPPLCPLTVSAVDFRRAARLIERSRTASERWLADGMDERAGQERFLSLHRHSHSSVRP